MAEQIALAGVGVLHVLAVESGGHVGVIHHKSGRRELVFYDSADEDTVEVSIDLTADESARLAEVIGAASRTLQLVTIRKAPETATCVLMLSVDKQVGEELSLAAALDGIPSGTQVVAIVREGKIISEPSASLELLNHDQILLLDGLTDTGAIEPGSIEPA